MPRYRKARDYVKENIAGPRMEKDSLATSVSVTGLGQIAEHGRDFNGCVIDRCHQGLPTFAYQRHISSSVGWNYAASLHRWLQGLGLIISGGCPVTRAKFVR